MCVCVHVCVCVTFLVKNLRYHLSQLFLRKMQAKGDRLLPSKCPVNEVIVVHEEDGRQEGVLVAPSLAVQVEVQSIQYSYCRRHRQPTTVDDFYTSIMYNRPHSVKMTSGMFAAMATIVPCM